MSIPDYSAACEKLLPHARHGAWWMRQRGKARTVHLLVCKVPAEIKDQLKRRQLGAVELTAACNAAHSIEARLCRRLLMVRDLAGSDKLPLTQQHLSQMLGVRRNSVSLAAIALRQAGLIRYSRGIMQIIDGNGLIKRACSCYTVGEALHRHSEPPVRRTLSPL